MLLHRNGDSVPGNGSAVYGHFRANGFQRSVPFPQHDFAATEIEHKVMRGDAWEG